MESNSYGGVESLAQFVRNHYSFDFDPKRCDGYLNIQKGAFILEWMKERQSGHSSESINDFILNKITSSDASTRFKAAYLAAFFDDPEHIFFGAMTSTQLPVAERMFGDNLEGKLGALHQAALDHWKRMGEDADYFFDQQQGHAPTYSEKVQERQKNYLPHKVMYLTVKDFDRIITPAEPIESETENMEIA